MFTDSVDIHCSPSTPRRCYVNAPDARRRIGEESRPASLRKDGLPRGDPVAESPERRGVDRGACRRHGPATADATAGAPAILRGRLAQEARSVPSSTSAPVQWTGGDC